MRRTDEKKINNHLSLAASWIRNRIEHLKNQLVQEQQTILTIEPTAPESTNPKRRLPLHTTQDPSFQNAHMPRKVRDWNQNSPESTRSTKLLHPRLLENGPTGRSSGIFFFTDHHCPTRLFVPAASITKEDLFVPAASITTIFKVVTLHVDDLEKTLLLFRSGRNNHRKNSHGVVSIYRLLAKPISSPPESGRE